MKLTKAGDGQYYLTKEIAGNDYYIHMPKFSRGKLGVIAVSAKNIWVPPELIGKRIRLKVEIVEDKKEIKPTKTKKNKLPFVMLYERLKNK